MCEACQHADHVGVCGEFVQKHGIEDQCLCLIATEASLDTRRLRTREVIQQADIREAQQRDWDALSAKQQERIRRRVQYRRMKL
jgi:hypothetical protein